MPAAARVEVILTLMFPLFVALAFAAASTLIP
jgi:hypothetical protein